MTLGSSLERCLLGGLRDVDHRHRLAVGDDDVALLAADLLQRVDVLAGQDLLVEPVLASTARQRDGLGHLGVGTVDDLGGFLGTGAAADDLVGVGLSGCVDPSGLGGDPSLLQVGPGLLGSLLGGDHLGDGLLGVGVQRDVAQVDLLDDDAVLLPGLGEASEDGSAEGLTALLDLERRQLRSLVAHDVAQLRVERRVLQALLVLELVVDRLHVRRVDRVSHRDAHGGIGALLERHVQRGAILTLTTSVGVHLDGLVADVEHLSGVPRSLAVHAGIGRRSDDLAGEALDDHGLAGILCVEGSEPRDQQSHEGERAAHSHDDPWDEARLVVVVAVVLDGLQALLVGAHHAEAGHERADDGDGQDDQDHDDSHDSSFSTRAYASRSRMAYLAVCKFAILPRDNFRS